MVTEVSGYRENLDASSYKIRVNILQFTNTFPKVIRSLRKWKTRTTNIKQVLCSAKTHIQPVGV